MSICQRILWRLRKALGVRSPSAEIAKGCAAVADDFKRGLDEGMKNPLFRISEDGRIMQVREMTPDELRGLAACREIVARAFPGYFDDEEAQE